MTPCFVCVHSTEWGKMFPYSLFFYRYPYCYFIFTYSVITCINNNMSQTFNIYIGFRMAFPLWLLSNILFFMVIRYGAYYLSLTGGCLLLSNFLFATIRNAVPVEIYLESQPLKLHYGWCFWLVLFTGRCKYCYFNSNFTYKLNNTSVEC